MRIPVRIYYEDTDCGGVVYYANYLKYFERGRTELLRQQGLSLTELTGKGLVFVVTKVEVNYRSPGRYDDLLILDTQISNTSAATITFEHTITREGGDNPLHGGATTLVTASVVLAAVGSDGRPIRLPEDVKKTLGL